MSQKITSRVEKLEEACGVNQPCEFCDFMEKQNRRWTETLTRYGYQSPALKESDIRLCPCAWCGRPVKTSFANFTASERALFDRMEATGRDGTMCALENATLFDEIFAACKRADAITFGEAYQAQEVQELKAAMLKETIDLTNALADRGIMPRLHYICRVDGCACNYPKSESEYQANLRVRMKRAA
jgi:hypothetical protein